jgi:DNA-binding response OmpR family regulator
VRIKPMADYTNLIRRLEARSDPLAIEAAKTIRQLLSDKRKPAVFGRLTVYPAGRGALVDNEPLYLPRQQAIILSVLAAHPNSRVGKDQFYSEMWEADEEPEKIRDAFYSHMSHLRATLKDFLGYNPIDMSRHLGYMLLSGPRESLRTGVRKHRRNAPGRSGTPASGLPAA